MRGGFAVGYADVGRRMRELDEVVFQEWHRPGERQGLSAQVTSKNLEDWS